MFIVSIDDVHGDRTGSFVALASGAEVSHYRIIEKIGSGGMGDVYLAQDEHLDRRVALKFLPPHLCRDADCRARFKREAQAAAKLSHPNIITIHEVGEYQGQPFFAMEHLEGQTLKELIKRKELPLSQVIDIAVQLCEGLHEAHSRGITHRDIKPSNITCDGKGRCKILDFGLATVKGTEHLTQAGSTLGTMGYMSPEQARGGEIDVRSDLFSLGVVLYEMLTGRGPFARETEMATIKAVAEAVPEPLARYKADVPQELQRIVSKLLQKDPALRYQTAADVISDLTGLKRSGELLHGTRVRTRRMLRPLLGVAALLLVAVIAYGIYRGFVLTGGKSGEKKIMLAVLPFENLGAPEDEYFADGITEEITTNLTGLSGLGIISRTSSEQYKNTVKSLRQIGKELKVDYILEGTIRWEKKGSESRVRINPQLIRVSDDMHLWADKFDAVLTDVFAVQSSIAQEVATALDVTLLQTEQEALSREVKVDPRAYDFFLRAKQYFSIAYYGRNEYLLAEKMLLKAIDLSPEFAQAYAELGCLYTEMYWEETAPSPQRLHDARKMIDTALQLAPNMPETHLALGWYYYHGLRDYDRALDEFTRVIELKPNNVLARAAMAWVQRRQGKWNEAITGLETVTMLDPLDPWYKYELGLTYNYCRRYQDAVIQLDKGIDLQPNHVWAYIVKSWALFNQNGDTREARAVLDAGRTWNGRQPESTWLEAYYDLCDRQYDRALSLLSKRGDVLSPDNADSTDYYSLKGLTYRLMGRQQYAEIYLDSARVELEHKLSTVPDAVSLLRSLAYVYAGLGLNDKAIAAAMRAVELDSLSNDALSGPISMRVLAFSYAIAGRQDQALELFRQLLTVPSYVSANSLRLAPELADIRDNPRFKALLEEFQLAEGL